ncbi:UNVERIFIED_CONTAM: hypothetical protein FKN15_031295 [Acipenser sinensis]
MRSIAWTSRVRIQALPQPTMDGELPGGGAQLAERRPGGGRVRSARVSSAHRAPATPVVWPGACGLACKLPRAALSSDAVALRRLHEEDRKLANITQEHLISKDSDGDTFLHIAVAQGRRALSYVLARKMASFGMLDVKERNGQSALQVAVAANQHLIVQDLLSLGAQINTADCWGRTPLHVCAEKGHAQTIQAIQKGVLGNGQQLDLEAINYDGMTALHRAVVSHNAGVQELQKTLQPRSPHIQGLLIKNKRLVNCIKTLLQMGATIHAKN